MIFAIERATLRKEEPVVRPSCSISIGSLRRALGYAVCLLVLPLAACAQSKPEARPRDATGPKKRGKVVMQIQFVRAGGFAGPATRVAGTLTFEDSTARVTSDGTGYHRDLPASEAEPLRTAARAAALDKEQGAPGGSPPVPDAFEYRITITPED